MGKDGLNKKVGYGMLAEFYAPLLTDRQQAMIELYCDEDLSLSEIAGQLSISRQAVSDNLNRAYDRLDELENHLQLYSSFVAMRRQVERCSALLKMVVASPDTKSFLTEAMESLAEGPERKGGKDGI
jgi:predicted DNA-binding protein YlxM (UPF0122 family)